MAWPEDRPGTYDPDLYWDETNGVWSSTFVAGPGSWIEYMIAISEEGEIYFRTV